jgi:hypothetical protein
MCRLRSLAENVLCAKLQRTSTYCSVDATESFVTRWFTLAYVHYAFRQCSRLVGMLVGAFVGLCVGWLGS